MNFEYDVLNRLTRIESKIARGFEEQGIDIDVDPNWMTVDDSARVIYVSTMGRSLKIVHSEAIKRGAKQKGKEYDVVHRGETVATITL